MFIIRTKLNDSWDRNDAVLLSSQYFAVTLHQSHFCSYRHENKKKKHNYKSVTVSSICHAETFKKLFHAILVNFIKLAVNSVR